MKQNIYDNKQFFEGYQKIRENPYNFNTLLENPAITSILPNINGLTILDVGCGAGDFAASCIHKGASFVKGIDISNNMIQLAKQNYSHDHLIFEQASMENMKLEQGFYDVIVSSLAIHYVEDLKAVLLNLHSALADNGQLVMSMQHPIYTSSIGQDSWLTNEEGKIDGYKVSNYFSTGARSEDWLVNNVVMYHRTFSEIINDFINAGFTIQQIVEPTPSKQQIELMPKIEKITQSPAFLIVKATI